MPKVKVVMYVDGVEHDAVETECKEQNVDFLWNSLTAQCEDVDDYAEEQRALGGDVDEQ